MSSLLSTRSIRPSQYVAPQVMVRDITKEISSQIRDFGKGLNGEPILCTPKATYSVEVTYPPEQDYFAKSRTPDPKAGKTESDIFHEVDPSTFEQAQKRSLETHGMRGKDVLERSAADYAQMKARLFVNETGEGGLGVKQPEQDGRVESMGGFNIKKTDANPNRRPVDVVRKGILTLNGVNVSECMEGLADMRLKTEGSKTVATLPITARLPEGWPQERLEENIHALVRIPSRPPSPSTLDKPPVACTTKEEFYQAHKNAFDEMYKNYKK